MISYILRFLLLLPMIDVEMTTLVHMAYPKAIQIPDKEGLLPIHKAAEHASLDVIKVSDFLLHVSYIK